MAKASVCDAGEPWELKVRDSIAAIVTPRQNHLLHMKVNYRCYVIENSISAVFQRGYCSTLITVKVNYQIKFEFFLNNFKKRRNVPGCAGTGSL